MSNLFSETGVHVREKDGVITIEVNQGWLQIAVLGTTVPVNTSHRGEFSSAILTLYPEKGKDGIIALALRVRKNQMKGGARYEHYHGLFQVMWETGAPWLNTDTVWCDPHRMARTETDPYSSDASWCALEVLVGGTWFSSHNYHQRAVEPEQALYVPDGDVLCRYLTGGATAYEVNRVAIPLDEKRIQLASKGISELVLMIQDRDVEISVLTSEKHALEELFKELDSFVQRVFRQALGVLDPLCDFLAHIPGRWRPRRMTDLLILRDWLAKADERNRYWVGRTASS